MKKSFFVSAVIAIALTACHSMGFDSGAPPTGCAEANTHCIAVSVARDSKGQLGITVDRQKLTVHGPSHVIFWRITDAAGYSFASNGIAFKTAAGQRQFSCVKQQAGVFRCLDPNNERGEFEYGIKLDGSPPVPPLDPWVVND